MASVMAIVSKAVFDKLGKLHGGAELGTVLPLDRYASTHKALSPLADGGALFLVTVRPPDEQLWLVACLEDPALDDDGWTAAPNVVAIRDISSLRSRLVFASGTGIQAKPGALGMSLQTPRALTDEDVALLRGALGGASAKAKATTPTAKAPKAKATAKQITAKPTAKQSTAKPQPSAAGNDLSALEDAIERDDAAAALTAALALWRATRAPAVADLVDELSGKIVTPAIEDERAFAASAGLRDPTTLGPLLAAITSLPVSFLPQAAALLVEFPLDPRIAMAVANWALDPPTTSSSTYPFWTKLLEYGGRVGDVRTIPLIEKRLRTKPGVSDLWAQRFAKGLERMKAAIEEIEETIEGPPIDGKALGKLATAAAKLDDVELVAASASPAGVETPTEAIDKAATHLAAGRLDGAIDQLLIAWRATRAPELADTIDRATQLSPWYRAPLGTEPKDIHAAWMDAFASDAIGRMPQLLAAINIGGPSMAEQRLTKLATLVGDDPRISLRLAELSVCDADRVSPERTQYWKALFELIARMRDVRVCGPLRAQFRDFAGKYYNHHRQGRRIVGDFVLHPEQAFGGAPPMLDAATRKQLANVESALDAAFAKRDRREHELLSGIAREWKSDDPRLVYADWLGEREHPRGEYIVLACKRSRSAAEEKRFLQLEQAPGTWASIRELGNVTAFDRGIPIRVMTHYESSTLTWRSIAGASDVALLESISFKTTQVLEPEATGVAHYVLHPDHLRLRALEGLSKPLLADLAPLVRPRWKIQGANLVRAN